VVAVGGSIRGNAVIGWEHDSPPRFRNRLPVPETGEWSPRQCGMTITPREVLRHATVAAAATRTNQKTAMLKYGVVKRQGIAGSVVGFDEVVGEFP